MSRNASAGMSLRVGLSVISYGCCLACLFAVNGCGSVKPIATPPTLTLQFWRDPLLMARPADIAAPFLAASPALPVMFVPAAFTRPLPHQHNVYSTSGSGPGWNCCGWHVSNEVNYVMEWKINALYSEEEGPTLLLIKALVCTHEIGHYWFNHTDGSGNVMNPTIGENLPMFRMGLLPSFTVPQANKMLKTIL